MANMYTPFVEPIGARKSHVFVDGTRDAEAFDVGQRNVGADEDSGS